MFKSNLRHYPTRKKIIKRIILLSLIIAGIISLFFISSNVFVSTINVNADDPATGEPATQPINPCGVFGCLPGVDNPTKYDGDDGVIVAIMQVVYFLIYIGIAVSILFIVLGGYRMMVSNGNEDNYKKGLQMLQNSVFGLIIAMISMTLVYFVSTTIANINIFS